MSGRKQEGIDRYALVHRHHPTYRQADLFAPLAVGNGEFAFTADITGLQSFPENYDVPLGTQSQWGWHSSEGNNRYQRSDLRPQMYDTYGREVGYYVDGKEQEEAFHWLRQNPHRLQLAQIGMRLLDSDGRMVSLGELTQIEQTLDLWQGMLTSRFTAGDVPVTVQTCCHPSSDQLSFRIESALLTQGRLEIAIGFPSPRQDAEAWADDVGLNWNREEDHESELTQTGGTEAVFIRTMDEDGYKVAASWSSGSIVRDGRHRFRIVPAAGTGEAAFEGTFAFSPPEKSTEPVSFAGTAEASRKHWAAFWTQGGAIDLSQSSDPRALELERRIVLSQFLTAIHCAGSLPPQETGLLYNSWYGKFHLEMHWWHAVHFALWDRTPLLRKSLGFYNRILPAARALAREQGYAGARWPKMVGPEGSDSPSPIGPLLIWQQPHPIVYAELCYLAEPTAQTLEAFRDVVMETAAFMASFAVWEEAGQRYVLGPPVIPAQEEHKAEATLNPTFELEYWRHGLELAQSWRQRLGMEPDPDWQHVLDHLSALPAADGVYLAHERCPDTFSRVNTDHPSMLGALGILPGKLADPETMRRTLYKVRDEWDWPTSWGWDFPMAAMTAARLGEGRLAVDLLLFDTKKNTYLPNGHNDQRAGLSAYLPGNGGLLSAVAVMACGWQGSGETDAPGFPKDGSWIVRWEGLNPWL